MQLEQRQSAADPMVAFANAVTGRWLAGELAAHHSVHLDQVFDALTRLPLNLAPLLASPEGHTMLGCAAGGMLPRMNSASYLPTIH